MRRGCGLQGLGSSIRAGGCGTHHTQGRDGLLMVLEGCQPQAVDGEEHQLRPRHQQDHLGAVPLHEVRRHHGVWQVETCNLLYFLKEKHTDCHFLIAAGVWDRRASPKMTQHIEKGKGFTVTAAFKAEPCVYSFSLPCIGSTALNPAGAWLTGDTVQVEVTLPGTQHPENGENEHPSSSRTG